MVSVFLTIFSCLLPHVEREVLKFPNIFVQLSIFYSLITHFVSCILEPQDLGFYFILFVLNVCVPLWYMHIHACEWVGARIPLCLWRGQRLMSGVFLYCFLCYLFGAHFSLHQRLAILTRLTVKPLELQMCMITPAFLQVLSIWTQVFLPPQQTFYSLSHLSNTAYPWRHSFIVWSTLLLNLWSPAALASQVLRWQACSTRHSLLCEFSRG